MMQQARRIGFGFNHGHWPSSVLRVRPRQRTSASRSPASRPSRRLWWRPPPPSSKAISRKPRKRSTTTIRPGNGVEVYIGTRSKPMYDKIELDLQDRINSSWQRRCRTSPKLRADIQEMLAKYDEAIDMVSKGAPLNALLRRHCRLRIERSHLREVIRL